MIPILHVIEPGLVFGLSRTLEQMLGRLPDSRVKQTVCALASGKVPVCAGRPSHRVSRCFSVSLLQGFGLRRAIRATGPGLVHTWGFEAAAAAVAARPGCPIVVSVDMPQLCGRVAERWMAVLRDQPNLSVICPADRVKRRLVEHGFPVEVCVVIRPGVDYAAINAAAKHFSGQELGLDGAGPVLLTPGPPHRQEGQYAVMWAAALLQHIHKRLRVVIPGQSREFGRLKRFTETVRLPDLLIAPGDRFTWEELLSVADVVVAAPPEDIGITPVAWAMAAGVPIVATATHALTEVLADRHNALLCKPKDPRILAGRILAVLDDQNQQRKITNEARDAAFEVFSVRRCLHQHLTVYQNIPAGKPPADQVKDSAILT